MCPWLAAAAWLPSAAPPLEEPPGSDRPMIWPSQGLIRSLAAPPATWAGSFCYCAHHRGAGGGWRHSPFPSLLHYALEELLGSNCLTTRTSRVPIHGESGPGQAGSRGNESPAALPEVAQHWGVKGERLVGPQALHRAGVGSRWPQPLLPASTHRYHRCFESGGVACLSCCCVGQAVRHCTMPHSKQQ